MDFRTAAQTDLQSPGQDRQRRSLLKRDRSDHSPARHLLPLHGAYSRPGSAAWADHPRRVNLREADVLEPLNGWIGRLFDRDNVDRTVAALVASQDGAGRTPAGREAMKTRLAEAEVYAMIDSLDDVGAVLSDARPESLSRLYRDLRLELRYEPHERAVVVTASPRVVNECVRGGT